MTGSSLAMYKTRVHRFAPALLLLTACGGAGQYGFAREYVPLDAEEPYIEETTEISYEEVRRDPADFSEATVAWFGVVTAVAVDPSGSAPALVSMTFRTHQARHLCRDETRGSCRVTVSERAGGPFSALVEIRPDDRDGETRLWNGSLLKVYGVPTGDFDDEGGPILRARWYRHWPRGYFVTTGAAGAMRR